MTDIKKIKSSADAEKKTDWVKERSLADNIKEIDWVRQQVKEDLNDLTRNAEDNFYEIKDNGKVSYKMNLVREYLISVDKEVLEDGELRQKDRYNTSTCIMAVQIVLESEWYDVGKVDGVFWDETREAIKKFQIHNHIKPADGFIWHQVVSELLKYLGEWKRNEI